MQTLPGLLVRLLCVALLRIVTSTPSWEELDRRPVPTWYTDAKFGIFLHWGIFSVPSFGNEWFQKYWQGEHRSKYVDFVNGTEGPGFTYSEYASRFRAELYHPQAWASAFAAAGAQYVVLTSKHHEGFCMWDSRDIPSTWQWNVMDVGPRRDLLGELAHAVRQTTSPMTNQTLHFGVYHSLFEWFNPLYLQDKANNFTTSLFVDSKSMAELYDLVRKYQPTLVWSDGFEQGDSTYWKAREFLHWYSTKSTVAPDAVWNDRWGPDTFCKHGSFLTCDDNFDPGQAMPRYYENCLPMDQSSWGYNRNASLSDYSTTKELVHALVTAVAQNGNLLLNLGPGADGRLPTVFLDRLRGMGDWLHVNGESIYGTSAWPVCTKESNDAGIYYTVKGDTLYAHVMKWPEHQCVILRCIHPTSTPSKVTMLGVDDESLRWKLDDHGHLVVQMPALTPDRIPCQHVWVLVLKGVAQTKRSMSTQ
mmetsp:Transcript_11606/g.22143  ORF Transcript_11606/g.22143 Transcript_11606/m.22143 type:complete len:474 (-) Transcript_11606:987-2408(-)